MSVESDFDEFCCECDSIALLDHYASKKKLNLILMEDDFEFDLYYDSNYPKSIFKIDIKRSSMKDLMEQINKIYQTKEINGIKQALKEFIDLIKQRKKQKTEEQNPEYVRSNLKRQLEKRAQELLKDPNRVKLESKFKFDLYNQTTALNIIFKELFYIMDNKNKLGFDVKCIDNNPFHWCVDFFEFDENSNVFKDMEELMMVSSVDTIRIELEFPMDIYPSYPPSIKFIYPKVDENTIFAITGCGLFSIENWQPFVSIYDVLTKIRKFFEKYTRIIISEVKNETTILENSILNLATLFDLKNFKSFDEKLTKEYEQALGVERFIFTETVNNGNGNGNGNKIVGDFAKGTGYSSQNSKGWDPEQLRLAQLQKDLIIEKSISDFIPILKSANKKELETQAETGIFIAILATLVSSSNFIEAERHLTKYNKVLDIIDYLINNDIYDIFYKNTKCGCLYVLLEKIYQDAKLFNVNGTRSEMTLYSERIINIFEKIKNFKPKDFCICKIDNTNIKDWGKYYIQQMQEYSCVIGKIHDINKYVYKHEINNSNKIRTNRIMRDISAIRSGIPIELDSSVFLFVDENHLDVMKVLITGPMDKTHGETSTPYGGGCFIFDVGFGATYPDKPPLCLLKTTGGGTVRFNPNLYDSGKVCLSLLGTWYGTNGEGWYANSSTLLQVLISIQSLILVPKPYFNEPGYQSTINTEHGENRSREYNKNIRKQTIRFAILDMLRNPDKDFEQVIKRHFYLKQKLILQQIKKMGKRRFKFIRFSYTS